MKELLPYLQEWTDKVPRFAIATVIQTWGSSPPGGLHHARLERYGNGRFGERRLRRSVIREAHALIENGTAKRLPSA